MRTKIRVPIEIDLTAVHFFFPLDVYIGIKLYDATDTLLADLDEEEAMELIKSLVPALVRGDMMHFKVDLGSGTLRDWSWTQPSNLAAPCNVATRIALYTKVRDGFNFDLLTKDGFIVSDRETYVPDFMPGNTGDYIDLAIDLVTGQVLGWKDSCDPHEMQRFLQNQEDNLKFQWPPRAESN